MLKKLIKDSLLYTFSSVITKGINFFLIPILTLYLTPRDYGILDMFNIFISLIGVSVGFELNQGLARYTSQSSLAEKTKYISSVLIFTIVIYAIFLLVCLMLYDEVNALITGDASTLNIFFLVLIILLPSRLNYILKAQLKWDLRPKAHVLISTAYSLLMSLFIYITVAIYNLGVVGYYYSQIIVVSLSLIAVVVLNRKYLSLYFSMKEFQKIFSFSFPLVLSSVTLILATYIDRIMIRSHLDLTEVGIYGMAFRFASLCGLILIGVQSSLMPNVYKNYKEESTRESLATFFNVCYVLVLFIILSLTVFSSWILTVMTQPEYYSAAKNIPILAISTIFGGMYVFAAGIGIMKKTKIYFYVGVFSLISNVVLNTLFIPIFGVFGASLATSVTSICCFLIYMYNSQKLYYVQYNWSKIIVASLAVVLFYFIFNYSNYQNQGSIGLFYIITLYALLIICIPIYVLGLPFVKGVVHGAVNKIKAVVNL